MTFPRALHAQLLLLALAVGAPLALLDVYSLIRESRANRELASESMRRLAASTAADIDGDLMSAKLCLDAIARRPEVRALDAARCDSIFRKLRVRASWYAVPALLDTACNVVCAPGSRAGLTRTPGGLRSWLRDQPPTLDVSVEPPTAGPTPGSRVSFLLVRVRDDQSRPKGWLEIPLDLRLHQRLLIPGVLPAGGEVLVLGEPPGDVVILSPRSPRERLGEHFGARWTRPCGWACAMADCSCSSRCWSRSRCCW
jgi:hypothetical protein